MPAPDRVIEYNHVVRLVLRAAGQEARRDRNPQVGTDHLLLGLAAPIGSDSSRVLELLGVSHSEVQARLGVDRERGHWAGYGPAGSEFSRLALSVVSAAKDAAAARGHREVTSGDLLVSLARHRRCPGGRFLARRGATPETVAAALAQVAEPTDIPVPDPASSAPPAPAVVHDGQDSAETVEVSVECSRTVHAPPDQAWDLMSSTQAWSLSPTGSAMFDVPDTDGMRFYIGSVPGWSWGASRCVVFQSATGPAPRQITLSAQTRPAGLCFTVSVHRALADDWAEIRVTGAVRVRDRHQRSVAATMRADLNTWLSAIEQALVGDPSRPPPGAPPPLVAEWAAEPRVEQPRRLSTSVPVRAGTEAVWNLVQRPWAPQVDAGLPVIYSGRIPGTPTGQPGEAWYGIRRRDDGSLAAEAMAVSQYASRRLTVRRQIAGGPNWPVQVTYRLAADGAHTRLEVEYQWAAAATMGRERAVSALHDGLLTLASGYQAAAESIGQ